MNSGGKWACFESWAGDHIRNPELTGFLKDVEAAVSTKGKELRGKKNREIYEKWIAPSGGDELLNIDTVQRNMVDIPGDFPEWTVETKDDWHKWNEGNPTAWQSKKAYSKLAGHLLSKWFEDNEV